MMNLNNQISKSLKQVASNPLTALNSVNRQMANTLQLDANSIYGAPKNYCRQTDFAVNPELLGNHEETDEVQLDATNRATSTPAIYWLKVVAGLLLGVTNFIYGIVKNTGKAATNTGTVATTGNTTLQNPPAAPVATGSNTVVKPTSQPTLLDRLEANLRRTQAGSILLDQAAQNGVKIEITNDIMEGASGVTYISSDGINIKLRPGDFDQMTETLTHELVHAATAGDGNSINEEVTASLVGEQVATETGINYNQRSKSDIENAVRAEPVYSELPEDNGVINDLRALGINA